MSTYLKRKLDMLESKIQELVSKYEKEVKERSSHKNPMFYTAVRNLQWAQCLLAAVKGEEMPQQAFDAICGIKSKVHTSLSEDERLAVHEGDNVMDILNKNRDIPQLHDKIEAKIKQAGLVTEGFYLRRK
jgi:hypothetical protein